MSINDLIAMSRSYSGYERERAVVILSKIESPRVIVVFLERVNDWVGVIKVKAEDALRLALTRKNSAFLIKLLPAIIHLKRCERYDHSQLVEDILSFLVDEVNKELLVGAILGNNQKVSAIVFKQCLERGLFPAVELVKLALKSKNLFSIRAVMPLMDSLGESDFLALYSLMIKLSYGPLLIKAFQRMATLNFVKLDDLANSYLYSSNVELRKLAKTHLGFTEEELAKKYYEAFTDSKNSIARRVVSLVEWVNYSGLPALDTLVNFSRYANEKIRKTSYQLIAKLLGGEAKSQMTCGLMDESASVRNESVRLCLRNGVLFSVDELVKLCGQASVDVMLRGVVQLARMGGKWLWLTVLLRLLKEANNQETVAKLNREIFLWHELYNLSCTPVTSSQLSVIHALAGENWTFLSEKNRQVLDFLFKTI